MDEKTALLYYLQRGRDAVVWKLEGLSEYDIRRPLVPTGTNLLGLVKHLAAVEYGYLGDVFGRPFDGELLGTKAADDDDLWARADETRSEIVGWYEGAWAHGDATIDSLDLDAVGNVPWWPPDRSDPTLHTVLVHLIAETHRHAGHADVVREQIDGAVGLSAANANVASHEGGWPAYRSRIEAAAREAGSG
jgi:Protein of unknown function (DUF664)